MKKHRTSLGFTDEERLFLTSYIKRKGIRGGIPGLISISLHAYVARNKAKGLTPPWEDENGSQPRRSDEPIADDT
jgi:hypothetical protein